MALIRDEFVIIDKFTSAFEKFLSMGEKVVDGSDKMAQSANQAGNALAGMGDSIQPAKSAVDTMGDSITKISSDADGMAAMFEKTQALTSSAMSTAAEATDALASKINVLSNESIQGMTSNLSAQSSQFQEYVSSLQQVDSELATEMETLQTLTGSYQDVINAQGAGSEAALEYQMRVEGQIDYVNQLIDSHDQLIASIGQASQSTEQMVQANDHVTDSVAGSVDSIGNWTDSVGNYSLAALEAVYSTEELVKMGFKSAEALTAEQQALDAVANAERQAADSAAQLALENQAIAATQDQATGSIERMNASMTAYAQQGNSFSIRVRLLESEMNSLSHRIEQSSHSYEQLARSEGAASEAAERQKAVMEQQISSMDKLTARHEELTRRQYDTGDSGKKASDSFNSMGSAAESLANNSLSKLLNQLFAVVAALLSVKSMTSSVSDAMSKERFEIRFQGVFGDEAGSSAVQWARQFADEAGRTTNDILSATSKFAKVTTKGENLEALNRLSDRIAMFTDKNDFTQISDSIQRALMLGNTRSLTTATGISKNILENFKVDEFAKAGDIAGFVSALDQAAKAAGMTEEVFDKMTNSSQRKWDKFKNGFKNGATEAADSFLRAFGPAFDKLNTWLKTEDAQKFFTTLASVMYFAGAAAGVLVDAFLRLSNFLNTELVPNITILEGLFIALGVVAVVAGIKAMIAWIAAAWPILLIVGIIIGLIYLFMTFTEEVFGAAYVLGALFSNLLMFFGNLGLAIVAIGQNIGIFFLNLLSAIQAIVENIGIAFLNLGQGIQNVFDACGHNITAAFNNAWISVQQSFNKFVSHLLGGISDILNALDSIPGVTVDTSGVEGAISNIEGKSSSLEAGRMGYKDVGAAWNSGFNSHAYKDVGDAFNKHEYKDIGEAFNTLEYKDIGEAWQEGKTAGGNTNRIITDKLEEIKGKISEMKPEIDLSGIDGLLDILQNGDGDIGNVGSVGKIRDDVNIADEDLKMLVDIAEKKYTAEVNVQHLSPQVSIYAESSPEKPIDPKMLAELLKKTLIEQVAAHGSVNYNT